jgi:hypothetical protein
MMTHIKVEQRLAPETFATHFYKALDWNNILIWSSEPSVQTLHASASPATCSNRA